MKELIRNPNNGALEVWENGKKIGEIITIGDNIKKDDKMAEILFAEKRNDGRRK